MESKPIDSPAHQEHETKEESKVEQPNATEETKAPVDIQSVMQKYLNK